MVCGIILNIALVGYGLILCPSAISGDGLWGVGGVLGVLIAYGLAGWWGTPSTDRRSPHILRSSILFGLLIGAVFVVEMLLEYLILPADNTQMGLIEFGIVFVLLFVAGVRGAQKTELIGLGVLTALWSALIGSLVWFNVVLIIHYLFSGTPQQAQVLHAEGTYADYQRSGMHDFGAFVMQDLLGAGFFHLLLSPVLAVILGALGSFVGKGLVALQSRLGRSDTRRV
jgi:hypothetical protein